MGLRDACKEAEDRMDQGSALFGALHSIGWQCNAEHHSISWIKAVQRTAKHRILCLVASVISCAYQSSATHTEPTPKRASL